MTCHAARRPAKTVTIRDVVARWADRPAALIRDGHDLFADLGFDSFDLPAMTLDLEEAFGVVIGDETAERFKTVADVERELAALLTQQDDDAGRRA